MKKILISVVCYDNEDEVIDFAKKVAKQNCKDMIILNVTCNKIDNIEEFKKKISMIDLIINVYNPNSNLGYLPGCLYGIEQYSQENIDDYDWVMISNTDISFDSDNFFHDLFNATLNNNIWCIGTNIVLSKNQKVQNPFATKRPSKTKMIIWKIVYSKYCLFKLYYKLFELKQKISKSSNKKNISSYVYAVHGSCFFLKRECINKIMNYEKMFMYDEELFIAEIIRANNKKIYFDKSLTIFHNENQVTGKIPSKTKQLWFKDSINTIYNQFYKNR